jgi:hypothetical protein
MRKLLLCLLPLLCLLAHNASSQTFTYTLHPGDVVKQRMIGIDTASYGQSRRYMYRAGNLILTGQNLLAELQHKYDLSQAASIVLQNELKRTRQEHELTEAELAAVAKKANKLAALPLQKPLLLDLRTYEVGGTAGAVAFLIALLIHK